VYYTGIIKCRQFDTWPQLTSLLNGTNLTLANEINVEPRNPLLLTSDLKIRQLIAAYPPIEFFEVEIFRLKGVDVTSWRWPETKNNIKTRLKIDVIFSNVAFYINERAPGQYNCTEIMRAKHSASLNPTFFSYFELVNFQSLVVYNNTEPWCPYVFRNASLSNLKICCLVENFLIANLIKFERIRTENITSWPMDSKISKLVLQGYNYNLNEELMHPFVFEKVETLWIFESIGSIQADLFKHFKYLYDFEMSVFSLKNFFDLVGIHWTSSLNRNSLITFMEGLEYFSSQANWINAGSYDYPTKDLCIFAPLPIHNKSLLVVLDSNLTVCTDTIAWLTQTYSLYNLTTDYNLTENAREMFSKCWQNNGTYTPNMTFIQLEISACLLNSTTKLKSDYAVYADYYEVRYIVEFILDLFAFVLIPLSCILGILMNLRVIWTIHKNKEGELKEDFYQYMSINSIFNCLFCLMYVFYPINYCLEYQSGFFCSPISNSVAAQVIKIVFQAYFGEVVKMCSNISCIFITINRYVLIGIEPSPMLKNISEWEIKRVVQLIILFSLGINIGHVFQFRINYGWGIETGDYTVSSAVKDIYPSIVVNNSALSVYIIVYFLINFVMFLVINTCIELAFVLNFREEIAEKRKKVEDEIKIMKNNNAAQSAVVNKMIRGKEKKIEQDGKKETRAIMMVIVNSGINFFFRLPEILVFISGSHSLLGSNVLYIFVTSVINLPDLFVSLSYFAYILTFTTN
jgi:hypothetical protein